MTGRLNVAIVVDKCCKFEVEAGVHGSSLRLELDRDKTPTGSNGSSWPANAGW